MKYNFQTFTYLLLRFSSSLSTVFFFATTFSRVRSAGEDERSLCLRRGDREWVRLLRFRPGERDLLLLRRLRFFLSLPGILAMLQNKRKRPPFYSNFFQEVRHYVFQMSEWSSAVVANANVVLHITWLILFFKMAAFRHFRSKNIFLSGLVFVTENNYFVIYWYLLKYLVSGFDFRRKSLIALFLPQVYASPCMDR